jgi:phytoene desaturase (3,4-didehydrolycopene-forming)
MKRHAEQFDEARIASVRRLVLGRLAAVESLQGLKSSILNEVVDTPATYAAQYHVAAGSPFGLSHGLGQLSMFRPGPRVIRRVGIAEVSDSPSDASPPSRNSRSRVLCVGASSRPGNGVPLVLIGAKLTADIATIALQGPIK